MRVATASLLLAYALFAVWVLADPASTPDGTIRAAPTADGSALVVRGDFPTEAERDELFEALFEAGEVTAVVSEARITSDAAAVMSPSDLARELLDELSRSSNPAG